MRVSYQRSDQIMSFPVYLLNDPIALGVKSGLLNWVF